MFLIEYTQIPFKVRINLQNFNAQLCALAFSIDLDQTLGLLEVNQKGEEQISDRFLSGKVAILNIA